VRRTKNDKVEKNSLTSNGYGAKHAYSVQAWLLVEVRARANLVSVAISQAVAACRACSRGGKGLHACAGVSRLTSRAAIFPP